MNKFENIPKVIQARPWMEGFNAAVYDSMFGAPYGASSAVEKLGYFSLGMPHIAFKEASVHFDNTGGGKKDNATLFYDGYTEGVTSAANQLVNSGREI
jgi:hypothetical protein